MVIIPYVRSRRQGQKEGWWLPRFVLGYTYRIKVRKMRNLEKEKKKEKKELELDIQP